MAFRKKCGNLPQNAANGSLFNSLARSKPAENQLRESVSLRARMQLF
jgi:hypothetical protein